MAHGPTLACRLSQPTGGSALTVCVAALAVIQSRVGCGQSRPTAALRQPIANDH